ncbi:MBL fold metallo-hydrolase [Legionella drancourtii]|uniref:Zn-dependent hydrolase GumP n=1 Tax=Legionella drancourtii LLAP12 TaxID=658187 RepID=G9EKT9_9GAMM|nr:MBL fold metallo-hydrolase [Legionella drancourtii]EHL32050.1 Zn-dependent hydrolase GumP [Legionella drancourtii LLAP12]
MITYQLFEAGFCRHCERMTLKNGHFKQREYPSICALIKHERKGYILFDTGYTDRFLQLTQKFPQSLYRHLTPLILKKSLKTQLLEKGIQPTDINYIVISHFHADHIGGLHDFPNAQFICHRQAIDTIKHKGRLKALLKGFLPGLVPSDFNERTILLDNNLIKLGENLSPFSQGYDLFGDQQLILIPLPGHAKGHIGLYFKVDKEIFLIGDSCWHQETFKELVYPSNLTYFIHDNKNDYIQTIKNLHALYKHNKNIEIIPSHCEHIRKQIREEKL